MTAYNYLVSIPGQVRQRSYEKVEKMKLGKTSARPDAVKLKMSKYVDSSILPSLPAEFGHESLIPPKGWGALGNMETLDCVWAGAAHQTMMWNLERGQHVGFATENVLSDYATVTGYDAKRPETDKGTDMAVAASYRRQVGVVDQDGKRHKVAAYLAIKPGDMDQHLLALYLFGAVGIGIRFPTSANQQFLDGKPWDVVPGAPINGGHYVTMVAKRENLDIVTWGQLQQMTPAFLSAYNDESIVYLSEEMLTNGKSPEGLDLAQLQQDLAEFRD